MLAMCYAPVAFVEPRRDHIIDHRNVERASSLGGCPDAVTQNNRISRSVESFAMNRTVALTYGLVAYALFLVVFLYAIGFVGDFLVPKGIDDGAEVPLAEAIIVNLTLLGLFGVQHSIMARPAFKRWWTRFVPEPIERSTFVLATVLVLGILYWQWRPITTIGWEVETPAIRYVIWGVFALGWLIVLYATMLIDHFDLFGLRQVWLHYQQTEYKHRPFMARSLYRWVRHPLMFGFIVAFWAAPTMTQGHLLFAAVTTVYVLVAIQIEERDLSHLLGDDYRRYRQQTPMLLPLPKGGTRRQ
jgi:protein-S-isoprenylcysteine O-methyltransferase Ste14